ncbi:hypothetical protein AX16_010685 [Volvariella volvacea WC 439]|nr:hypothetical protein AX16_010685 [Volvariella volvacea WC 439]
MPTWSKKRASLDSPVMVSIAAASTSSFVVLETGLQSPQCHLPRARPLGSAYHPRQHAKTSVTTQMIFIVLLALASMVSFVAAYYLLTHRQDGDPVILAFKHPDRQTQAEIFKQASIAPPRVFGTLHSTLVDSGPPERFLAYLPHSGFNNQRIALENALVLARILNRTLLVPPARLGRPIPYRTFHTLYHQWSLSDKSNLRHCSKLSQYDISNPECFHYHDYINVPWNTLLNMTALASNQRIIHRPKVSRSWIKENLNISVEETLEIPDEYLYDYRFLDDVDGTLSPHDKYFHSVYIRDLALSPHLLVHFGTLFGSSRLHLKHPQHIALRKDVRRNVILTNPILQQTADAIVHAINVPYLAVHLRLTDGVFLLDQESYLRSTWWRVLHHVLQYSYEDVIWLEQTLLPFGPQIELSPIIGARGRSQRRYVVSPLIAQGQPPFGCRGKIHSDPRLGILNTPIFIATDLKNPRDNPILSGFRTTFPCAMLLDDFKNFTEPLRDIRNDEDGLAIAGFYTPLIDATIAARAEAVVGTEDSTFSTFLEDVLWPRYHE